VKPFLDLLHKDQQKIRGISGQKHHRTRTIRQAQAQSQEKIIVALTVEAILVPEGFQCREVIAFEAFLTTTRDLMI
jgi:hypothetical protein